MYLVEKSRAVIGNRNLKEGKVHSKASITYLAWHDMVNILTLPDDPFKGLGGRGSHFFRRIVLFVCHEA